MWFFISYTISSLFLCSLDITLECDRSSDWALSFGNGSYYVHVFPVFLMIQEMMCYTHAKIIADVPGPHMLASPGSWQIPSAPKSWKWDSNLVSTRLLQDNFKKKKLKREQQYKSSHDSPLTGSEPHETAKWLQRISAPCWVWTHIVSSTSAWLKNFATSSFQYIEKKMVNK